MPENGRNKMWIGILAIVVTIVGMTFGPLVGHVIANDQESRLRDSGIQQALVSGHAELNDKIHATQMETQKTLQSMIGSIIEIKSELKHMNRSAV